MDAGAPSSERLAARQSFFRLRQQSQGPLCIVPGFEAKLCQRKERRSVIQQKHWQVVALLRVGQLHATVVGQQSRLECPLSVVRSAMLGQKFRIRDQRVTLVITRRGIIFDKESLVVACDGLHEHAVYFSRVDTDGGTQTQRIPQVDKRVHT